MIYLDPGFFSDWGHYNSFADAIHREAHNRGIDLWHLTTADVSPESAAKFSLIRFFEHRAMLQQEAGFIDSVKAESGESLAAALKHRWFDRKTAKVLESFTTKVRDVLRGAQGLPEQYRKISLYMYTAHPLHVAALAEILTHPEFQDLELSVNLGLFYLNLDFCRGERVVDYENLLRWVSGNLEKFDKAGKIKVYADSERTIGRYQSCFNRTISLSPLILDVRAVADQPSSADIITVGFFGFAHEKQGYPLFKKLYEYLISCPEYVNLHFIVRHNTKFSTSSLKDLVAEFKGQETRITHVPGNFLPKEEYNSLINQCDIIAIPHSIEHYPCQTSGIFTEALLRHKLVIVPENTWMADKLQAFGSGTTFKSDDAEDFKSSFTMMLRAFDDYQSRADRNIAKFRSFNQVSSLFDILGIGDDRGLLP